MDKIESLIINDMCVSSATKLMEQFSVCQNGVPDIKISEMKSIYPFGKDNLGAFIAAENKNKAIDIYKMDDAEENLSIFPTGLSGHNIVAGFDKNDKICVFAVKGNKVFYTEETSSSKCEFTEPKELSLNYPTYGCTIDKLIIHSLNDDSTFPFVLAVVYKCETQYWLDLIYWGLSTGIFFNKPLNSHCFTFCGNTRQSLKLKVLESNFIIYDMYKNTVDGFYSLNFKSDRIKGLSLKDAAGSTFVLHQSKDVKNISVLVTDSDTKEFCIKPLFSDTNLKSFEVWEEKNGVNFSVNTDTIHHSEVQHLSDGEWNAGTLVPLTSGSCSPIFESLYYNGSINLFYISEEENTKALCRLEYLDGEEWNETKYEALSQGRAIPRACYSTEVTITDEKHKTKPVSDVCVKLSSEERTYVETCKGIFPIDKSNSVMLKTDAQGKLFFRQYCSKLDVPLLKMEFEKNDVIYISQSADIKKQLSDIDGNMLMNAQQVNSKTGKTAPLISDKYRTKENTDNIAKCIKSWIKQFDTDNLNVMSIKSSAVPDLGAATAKETTSWSLEFLDNGKTVYEEFSSDIAEEKIQLLKSEDMGMPVWITKIGNFFRTVAKSIVKVCKIVVTGAKTLFTFIIDGVKTVFETVISAAKDILKIVEIILKPVLVTFKEIFHWLASILGWDYVLYTKRAISGTVEFFMDWMPEKTESICNELCKKVADAQNKIDSLFDDIIKSLDPNAKCMDDIENNILIKSDYDRYSYELSNDPLKAKLSQMVYSNKVPQLMPDSALLSSASIIDNAFAKLEKFAELRNNEDFKNAENYFKSAFGNIDNFYSFILSGLLSSIKGLVHVILNGCIEVISVLASAFKEIMSVLKEILTREIELPLFTEIYSWISGEKMSLLDMSSLIIALPVTIVCKCVSGNVPFSSEKEADEFIEYIRKCFSDKKETCTFNDDKSVSSASNQNILKIMMTISAQTSVSFNIFSDALSIFGDETAKACSIFGIMSLAAEVLWYNLASPELYMSINDNGFDFAMLLWQFFSVGTALDTLLIYAVGYKYLEDLIAKIIKFVYGIIHIVLASIGIAGKDIPGYAFSAELGSAVIEVFGILFLCQEKAVLATALAIEASAALMILISNIIWCTDNSENTSIEGYNKKLLPV